MKTAGLVIISFVFVFASCKKDPEIKTYVSTGGDSYNPVIPTGWPLPQYNFESNPVTYDGFMLGRHLFYEPILSIDSSISCASCHLQVYAFTNGPGHPVSHGVHSLLGTRNSPALFNLTWSTQLMWDGAVNNLENQPIAPISNPIELNLGLVNTVYRIANTQKYKDLAKKAYGDTMINSQRLLKSFAQFLGLLVSYNSKYDKVTKGEDVFTSQENNGYAVYKAKCSFCHKEPLFSDYKFRNKGLPITFYQDSGRYKITQISTDMFKFKTPSLRNLAFTAPYMHDGRFTTLDDVLTFFTSGVATSLPNVDFYMTQPHSITAQEKNDLLSFLATLNDYQFINDARFKEIH
jgi:cytochrome c peroxidase